MTDNCLKVGEVYEIIIGMQPTKVLYIGSNPNKDPVYTRQHIVVFRGERRGEIKCLKFSGLQNYILSEGRLSLRTAGISYSPSKSEREFLDERLKRSGL